MRVPFVTLQLFVLSTVHCYDMSMPVSVEDYFPHVKDDLSQVVWVHACNSRAKLDQALNNSEVMMIEADIIAGQLEGVGGGGPPLPIMGHPPDTTGDLSLEQFLDTVLRRRAKKGIKLDFKSIAIFKASENVLEQFLAKAEVDFPVWVNADIVRGPGHPAGREVVEPNYFLKTCVDKFPLATISPGWTVDAANAQNLRYETTHIDEMTSLLAENMVVHPVTFPVHAGIASNSVDSLTSLIQTSVPGTTLTLWSGDGQWVNHEALRQLIHSVGKDKVFMDLPAEMQEAILNPQAPKEPKESGGSGVSPVAVASMALILLGLITVF